MATQKTVLNLMSECDRILDDFKGTEGLPRSLDEAKVILNAIGKKQKLISIQLEYAQVVGEKINTKDFDFVYKASK